MLFIYQKPDFEDVELEVYEMLNVSTDALPTITEDWTDNEFI